jgi:TIGR03009 family protein
MQSPGVNNAAKTWRRAKFAEKGKCVLASGVRYSDAPGICWARGQVLAWWFFSACSRDGNLVRCPHRIRRHPPGRSIGRSGSIACCNTGNARLPRTVKLQAQFEATRKFNNFGGVVKSYQGLAKFMRLPDNAYGLLIQLVEKDQPQRYERYLCTGTHFYIFRPEEKTVYFHTLPPRKANEVPDQGPMSFLFGISADEAKKRYKMQITQQDEWYTYVQIEPLFPKDQVDFLYARLAVLNKPTRAIPQYYPRQIYWVEPQKVEVTWDMVQLLQNESATQVDRRDFAAPQIPSGWQLKPIQQPSQPNQPSVVRPQQ